MKNLYIKLVFFLLFSILACSAYTQDVPPPPPPNSHGSNGNQNGGGAPLGGGLLIMLGMGSAYAARKFIKMRNKK